MISNDYKISGTLSQDSSVLRAQCETSPAEMTVERKSPFNVFPAHKDKRNTIGKTNITAGILLKKRDGFYFIFPVGSQDFEKSGCIYVACSLSCKFISGAMPELGKGFI